jgi:hypothetical protein
MAAVLLGLLIAAAIMVLWRRLAGALTHALEPGALLATGISTAAVAAAIHVVWSHRVAKRWTTWPAWATMAITSLAAAALVMGLWLPGTSLVSILAVVAILMFEEVVGWVWHVRRNVVLGGADIRVCPPSQERRESLSRRGEPADGPPPEEVVQQLTRTRTADETEELRGWLRVPFAAGQRTASVHLAFCPPLAAVPELAVEQIDGPEARLKTAQLLPYGARIDLKLAASSASAGTVLLEFVARAPIGKGFPACEHAG